MRNPPRHGAAADIAAANSYLQSMGNSRRRRLSWMTFATGVGPTPRQRRPMLPAEEHTGENLPPQNRQQQQQPQLQPESGLQPQSEPQPQPQPQQEAHPQLLPLQQQPEHQEAQNQQQPEHQQAQNQQQPEHQEAQNQQQPCGPASHALPSPAPSGEKSPLPTTTHDSPNAQVYTNDTPPMDQLSPASTNGLLRLPVTEARFAPDVAAPVTSLPDANSSGQVMQSPLPSLRSPQTRNFPLPLTGTDPSNGVPNNDATVSPDLQTQLQTPEHTPVQSPPLQSGTIRVPAAKRMRVGSQQEPSSTSNPDITGDALKLTQRINSYIAGLSRQSNLRREPFIDGLRLQLLLDASSTKPRVDSFFLIVHQIFCLWSIKRAAVHALFPELQPEAIDKGLFNLEQVMRGNDFVSPPVLSFFATFPTTTASSSIEYHHQVSGFILRMCENWPRVMLRTRQSDRPILVEELLGILDCRSVVLQRLIFTAMRRNLELNDGPVGGKMDYLFRQDQRAHMDAQGDFVPVAPFSDWEELEQRSPQLIKLYANIVSVVRQHQRVNATRAAAQQANQLQQTRSITQSVSQNGTQMAHPTPQGALPATAAGTSSRLPEHNNSGNLQSTQLFNNPNPLRNLVIPWPSTQNPPFQASQMVNNVPAAVTLPGQNPAIFNNGQIAHWSHPNPGPHHSQGPGPMMHPATIANASPVIARTSRPSPTTRPGTQLPSLGSSQYIQPAQVSANQGINYTPAVPFMTYLNSHPNGPRTYSPVAPQLRAPQVPTHSQGLGVPNRWPAVPRPPTLPNPLIGRSQVPMPVGLSQAIPMATSPSVPRTSVSAPGRQSAPESVPQSDMGRPLLPPKGYIIPRGEYAPHPYHDNALRMALHQVHLRSPVRARRDSGEADFNKQLDRHYQFVKEFAVPPAAIRAHAFLYEFQFDVDDVKMAHLSKIKDPLPNRPPSPPVAEYFDGSLRYRIRCCKLPAAKDPEQITESGWVVMNTSWPQSIFIMLNGVTAVTPRRAAHNGKDLPTELTEHIAKGQNTLRVSVPQVGMNEQVDYHAVAVEIVETRSHSHICNDLTTNKVLKPEATLLAIQKRLGGIAAGKDGNADDNITVLVKDLSIDLADPFSAKIFDIPARGATCTHMECFDLENFLKTRESKPTQCTHSVSCCSCSSRREPSLSDKWRCPICLGDARPCSLVIDGFLLSVRKKLEADGKLNTKSLLVGADGSWRPVMEADDGGDDEEESEMDTETKKRKQPAAAAPVVIEID